MGLIVLGLQIAGGIAAYGLFLRLFGIASWREAVNALRRPARQGGSSEGSSPLP
jgi:putative peptidoglycan lipid II flippase